MAKSVVRDIGNALAGLFGGGELDPERRMHLEVLFGLLGYLAKLDSLITSHEAEFINQLMDRLDLSLRERKAASEALQRGRNRELDVTAELRRFLESHDKGSTEVEKLYDALIRLAAADERLRLQERLFLEEISEELGFSEDELDRRLSRLQLKK